MTTQEFSEAFQLKYNYIISNAAPALDDFEVSFFLSSAQKEVVIGIYNGSLTGIGFEMGEDSRQYINHLIKEYTTNYSIQQSNLNPNSKIYSIPNDVWFRIIEWVNFNDPNIVCSELINGVKVQPITYDEYHTIKKNPFRKQDKRRVLRLDYSGNMVEVISDYNISLYGLKYIKHPTPIIISNLESGLTIDGRSSISECELNPVLHETILDRAVDLAKKSWQESSNSKV